MKEVVALVGGETKMLEGGGGERYRERRKGGEEMTGCAHRVYGRPERKVLHRQAASIDCSGLGQGQADR